MDKANAFLLLFILYLYVASDMEDHIILLNCLDLEQ